MNVDEPILRAILSRLWALTEAVEKLTGRINALIGESDLILETEHLNTVLLQKILGYEPPFPLGGKIWQLNPTRSSNMSTPAGGTSTFQFDYTPTGSIPPAGTTQTWTVDDTADISLAPSPDGFTCAATCVAAPTATS